MCDDDSDGGWVMGLLGGSCWRVLERGFGVQKGGLDKAGCELVG